MVGVLLSRTKTLKKLLNNEFQWWLYRNYFGFIPCHGPNLTHSPFLAAKHFSTCQGYLKENIENIQSFNPAKMVIRKDGSVEKKKKPVGVKVYLLNDKGISSSLLLQDAEKIAKKQKLELKKVDSINGIPAYKLVPISELLETEGSEKDGKKKSEKIKKVIIGVDIKSNDFQFKINNIYRFLEKGKIVFIKLGERGDEPNKLSAVYSELEKSLAQYSIKKLITKSGYQIHVTPQEKDSNNDKKKE